MVEENKGPRKQPVAVSRIVLYKTKDGDRPMLIVKVWDQDTVNGIIFLDSHNDRLLVTSGMKEGSMMVWATSIPRGKEIGQWRFHNE